jgi:hypothetical protein
MSAKIIILFLMAVILLSVPVLTQNLPMVYADQSQIPAVTTTTTTTPSAPDNTAKIGASNSNPHSSIKVSSIDQHVLPFSPAQISTSSPNAAQQQLRQPTQQIQQQPHQQQSFIPPYNTISNDNTAKIGASNSNPHSSIKVSSIDQHVLPFSPAQISTSSSNAAQQQQPEQQQQLQQQIQQILTQSSYVPSNTNSLSTSNSNSQGSSKVTSMVPPFSPAPISTSSPTISPSQNDRSQVTNSRNDHQSISNLVVNAGSPVTLDGSTSYDPDGNPMTFAWTQTGGPSVMISDANTSKAKFSAPNLATDTIMLFKLTVTDGNGLSDSGIVQITVIPGTPTPPSLGSSMN